MGTLYGWLRDALFALPSLIWQRKMKRRLRDLADRLEAFREERRAARPVSPTTDARSDYLAAVRDWQEETQRLFQARFLSELRELQDELDDREISDRQLWERDQIRTPVRLKEIAERLRKLARRKRLQR